MIPMLAFLQRNVPSSPAHVMQLSCISVGRALTDFRFDQDLQVFPPVIRFPLAHIIELAQLRHLGTEYSGLVRFDESRVTRSTRPRTGRANFSASGANEQIPENWRLSGLGLGSPWRVARRAKRVAVAGAWRSHPSSRFAWVGPSSMPGSWCRTSFACLVFAPCHSLQKAITPTFI